MIKSMGVDIGGTEIKGAIVNSDYSFNHVVKNNTNAKLGLKGIVDALDLTISELLKDNNDIIGIGVASAGNINSNSGEVIYATDNLPNYTGFNIINHVENKFKMKCFVENDAYAALLGELTFGCAREYSDCAMITLGTGVGGAIALNSKILHGSTFSAGRFGHTILVPNGRPCNCGQCGCAEQYLSGTAFTAGAIALGYSIKHGSEIFEFIKQGDKVLLDYMMNYLSLLSIFCDTIINTINPQAIILGGGLANSDFWFDDYFMPLVKDKNTKFLRATLKNTAGFIGASSLVFNNHE